MDGASETTKRYRERAIPPDSRLIEGPGDCAIYIYEVGFTNRKGVPGKTFYAKAFRYGERMPAWHKSFRTAIERAKTIGALLDAEETRFAAETASAEHQISTG